MRKLLLLLFVLPWGAARSQQAGRFNPDTIQNITMDAVELKVSPLTAERFIQEILGDTSFYDAFRNMKKYSFVAENSLYTYTKKNQVEGKLYRKILHRPRSNTKIQYLAKVDSGKLFKKNGKYDLYTLEMFDYIFMNAYQSDYSPQRSAVKKGDSNASYKDKLKTLLFSPGRPVKGIPLISGKTEIFTPNMRQYYDYRYYSGMYLDSIPVYRFKVTEKQDLGSWTKGGIMIKELTTIFDKRNMQILGRYVNMKYSNLLFDFDIKMNIELGYFDQGEVLLPIKVSYQGNWDVPLKKEERASFLVIQKDYKRD